MNVKRVFLDWERPLPLLVSDYLLGNEKGPTADLGHIIVVVPTREAGRKLREAMAKQCASRGGGLLAARIVTPPFFLSAGEDTEKIAGPATVRSAWMDVLMKVPLADFHALFPVPVPHEEIRPWALRTGEKLESLRNSLLEAGLAAAEVPALAGGALGEPERWQDLCRLEDEYRTELERRGLTDRVGWLRKRSEDPAPPAGAERIVLAGCVDPQPIALRMVEKLARTLAVEVLVHAPESMAERFDRWGRPVAGLWGGEEEIVVDAKASLYAAEGRETLAEKAAALVSELEEGGDLPALAAVDPEVKPFLARELSAAGLGVFDPAGRSMRESSVFGLLAAFARFAAEQSYESLSVLLRQPAVLEYLSRSGAAVPEQALAEMDRLQNRSLPDTTADLRRALREGGRTDQARGALEALDSLVEAFRKQPLVPGVRDLLKSLYRGVKVHPLGEEGRRFLQEAGIIDMCLAWMEQTPEPQEREAKDWRFEILLRLLGGQRTDEEQSGEKVPLEGWLELSWSTAPSVVVAGFNEGLVPEALPNDTFLPDTLRRAVGLRCAADRYARDAFLARALLESRPEGGTAAFIVGRDSMEGDQLLPSRLLFAGDPLQAAERAEKLFGAPAAGGSAPVPSCGPLLDPWRLDARPPTRLRVSDFRRYLECPFRFYLGRVLGMERADDRKEELDARDYGEAVHHCLRELEEASWGGETDRGRIADLLQNKCDEWLGMRFGSRLPPAVAVQAVSIRNRLEAAAAVQAELAREGWRVVAAEVDLEMVLGDRTVSGRIDRIDCHEETGRYRILDYKTVDREKTPDKAHTGTWRDAGGFQAPERRGRRRRWTDLQLPLYAEMAASCGKAPPGAELGIFAIPAAAEDAGVLVWKEFDEEYRISAMAAAREVALRIGKGVFWPPAPHVPWDDFEFFRGPLAELVVPPEAGTEGEWE